MFQIIIVASLCLVTASTPNSAQLQQNAMGFRPTKNLIVEKLSGRGISLVAPLPLPPLSRGSNCEGSTPVPSDAKCPSPDLGYTIYYPSTDCNCFYRCDDNGMLYEIQCPTGLVFNLSLEMCDYPANVGCGDGNKASARFGNKTVPKKKT